MEIVVAITDNFVIGANGDIPWRLPADLKHFKDLTSGNTIVMGRRTWESIGRALPNRLNIVITRQKDFIAEGASVIHSLDELSLMETKGTIFIIGGGEVYKNTIEYAEKLHVTRIHTSITGDIFFPQFDESTWRCVESVDQAKNESNPYDLTFETWSRAK